MMKRVLLLLISALLMLPAMSQVTSSDDILRQIASTGATIKWLECDFEQTRHLSLMNEPAVSEGRMCFESPDRLRWEYNEPSSLIFILDGTGIRLQKDGSELEQDAAVNRFILGVARFIMESISGASLADEGSFDVSATADDGGWSVSLKPKKREMKKMWSDIVLHFDSTTGLAKEIELREPSGDSTCIQFCNVVINREIPSSQWNF